LGSPDFPDLGITCNHGDDIRVGIRKRGGEPPLVQGKGEDEVFQLEGEGTRRSHGKHAIDHDREDTAIGQAVYRDRYLVALLDPVRGKGDGDC
jgi:hypothetical protein